MLHHPTFVINGFILNLQTGSVEVIIAKLDRYLYSQPVVAEGIWLTHRTGQRVT